MDPSTHRVTWIGDPPAPDDDARLVWSAIVEQGLVLDVEIAALVAAMLVRRDLAATGPSSGAGLFRRFYGPEAWRLLLDLDGTRIRIGEIPAWVR
jgi:hypothetical protein